MPRRNFSKLLSIYRAIEKFQAKNYGVFPAFSDLVDAGVSSSNGDLAYCFRGMEEMGMLVYKRIVARSSRLIPLEQAAPEMRRYIEENE